MKIGVLMGGISNEREVSILSGQNVVKGLRGKGYDADPIIVRNDFEKRVNEYSKYDVLFNALHGYFGEDGQIQRILDSHDIVYTGCGVSASRTLMDKVASKKVFKEHGIPVPDWFVIERGSDFIDSIPERFTYPLVVKPPDGGSSVNVSIVHNDEEFLSAVTSVLADADSVLVEEYIQGRELTVGILGDIILPVIELQTDRAFYDYTAKYRDLHTAYLCPAPVSERVRRTIYDVAAKAFDAFVCRDMVRFDLMLDRKSKIFFFEGNTIPGLTDHSLLPKAAKTIGIDFGNVCTMLVDMALRRSRKTVPLH